jgi:hypothetical protein
VVDRRRLSPGMDGPLASFLLGMRQDTKGVCGIACRRPDWIPADGRDRRSRVRRLCVDCWAGKGQALRARDEP